jgi:hypothetical protein
LAKVLEDKAGTKFSLWEEKFTERMLETLEYKKLETSHVCPSKASARNYSPFMDKVNPPNCLFSFTA